MQTNACHNKWLIYWTDWIYWLLYLVGEIIFLLLTLLYCGDWWREQLNCFPPSRYSDIFLIFHPKFLYNFPFKRFYMKINQSVITSRVSSSDIWLRWGGSWFPLLWSDVDINSAECLVLSPSQPANNKDSRSSTLEYSNIQLEEEL